MKQLLDLDTLAQTLMNKGYDGYFQTETAYADKSAFDYYKDLSEKGYYNRMISGNVQQRIEVDSVVCNFDTYPYAVRTYAKQFIIRSSNVTRRNLITSCYLVNSVRSDNNPQGFNIEKFAVVENRDIEVIER